MHTLREAPEMCGQTPWKQVPSRKRADSSESSALVPSGTDGNCPRCRAPRQASTPCLPAAAQTARSLFRMLKRAEGRLGCTVGLGGFWNPLIVLMCYFHKLGFCVLLSCRFYGIAAMAKTSRSLGVLMFGSCQGEKKQNTHMKQNTISFICPRKSCPWSFIKIE